ncbi:MAG: formate dehydrogenase subunit gamma [Pseudomonadota bacterium]|nr:formate dehydrogenase subunit gamma [Pseudomonadota bacterium]
MTGLLAAWLAVAILGLVPAPQTLAEEGGSLVPNPGAELWRAVRQKEGPVVGDTKAQGVEAGVLIDRAGEWWRRIRVEKLVPYGAGFIGLNVALIVLWYLFRGRIRIDGGRSGRLVPRFDLAQRLAHWFLASLFLLLAVTGLVLLYGRFLLIPLVGEAGFSVIASASKEAHNLFGPIFPFAVIAVFLLFLGGNGFKVVDLKWIIRGGGLMRRHAPAGYYNAGEKLWFWAVILLGVALSVSGLILDFPIFGQGRQWMEWSLIVHGVAAVLLIAGFLGHIYLATLGMEGAIESITDGRVDANWAKQHHDLWYEQVKDQEQTPPGKTERGPAGKQPA